MFIIKNFEPREYQKAIAKTIESNNTLVVLPTGLGKTKVAIIAIVKRLNKIPGSKALILAPTKPLANQIYEEFKNCTEVEFITCLTGAMPPKKRLTLFEQADIIVATPQTIQSDLKNNRISLEKVSLLCIDEAHRSRDKFANTIVAKKYQEHAKDQRIIALTASPGGTKQKIKDICNNLNIEKVEIRTDEDPDVVPYIQKKDITWLDIKLPKEFEETLQLISSIYKASLEKLKNYGLTKPLSIINKKDLLLFQNRIRNEIRFGNKSAFQKASVCAQAIKLMHAVELLETQGATSLKSYWDKLKEETSKASQRILSNASIEKAIKLTEDLIEKKIEHPKITVLSKLVKEQIDSNKEANIMIFANYRFMVEEIVKNINNLEGIKAVKLIGQKEGLSQKEQINTIKEFEEGKYNCIVATSIGEEGLSLEAADLAIFYEPVASEIRTIQRIGRVGRTKEGKVIVLIAKGTRDEAYYWSAKRKENIMKNTLSNIQKGQTTLK
ncbi:MAG: DEAD/DEAH box helicase [Candidatus Nanoarchaeia archaeon]|nr:DEAD/DEAH box helicase [Candidatus Nanoarchaeia archaeon]